MPWRGHNATHCRICGRHRNEVGRISARYKCQRCGLGRMVENILQLHEHDGPAVERWRRGVAASVGAVLPDEAA